MGSSNQYGGLGTTASMPSTPRLGLGESLTGLLGELDAVRQGLDVLRSRLLGGESKNGGATPIPLMAPLPTVDSCRKMVSEITMLLTELHNLV